jgi:LmbE family N-acetylglucosaminyl deacetylase
MGPWTALDGGLADRTNVLVLAPHPDDEVFGAAGLMCALVSAGHRVQLVAVTDGEAAYGPLPASATIALIYRRARERHLALQRLGVSRDIELVRLGLPDGAVSCHQNELAEAIATMGATIIVSTWRHDGHPDHEAVGEAAAEAAHRTGANHWEYVVWAGHHGLLGRAERAQAWEVPMTTATRSAKIAAARLFRSQLEPSPDGRPVVPRELIDRLEHDAEMVLA